MSEFLAILDRAALEIFAGLMNDRREGVRNGLPVANLGTGSGHVTAYLHWLGVDAFGLDADLGEVMQARREYPKLSFDVGRLIPLEISDGALGGLVAWRCFDQLNEVMLELAISEFSRVLSIGGFLLFSFTTGRAEGEAGFLRDNRDPFEQAAQALQLAGFIVDTHMIYRPETGERVRHISIIVRKATGQL
ncbi:methyltransferase domain-containing protein [Streptomyces mirabilis]|uniref:Methyltransferase domain-containing protein n=1 Tax=Streptomyces mirabilis TaxID=68239 RepID=A0ABU3V5Z0_9ACTN|nr:methyltransferase domain-containing protein [Streptomyces mirabilis]MCX5357062.1 class I SAM-dependent methyltransferase [Streptomyces mirabilis]MDU9001599.1 methyltransferase domain-containing protein [Streptomyces mirabilis]